MTGAPPAAPSEVPSIARFCTRCGTPNPSGLATCSNCGNSLRMIAPAPPGPPVPPPMLWAGLPGPPPKRATVGTILVDTLTAFGHDVLTYVVVFLWYGAVITAITLALTTLVFGTPSGTAALPASLNPASITPDFLLKFLGLVVAAGALGLVIQSVITASLTYFVVQRCRGTPVSLGQAFSVGAPRFVSVLGASLIPILFLSAILAAALGVLLFGLATLDLGLACGGALLLIALLPVAIYVTIALSLSAPAIMMERKTAIGGLKRSWGLTRGRRLTLFLVLFVLGILIAVIQAAVTIPFLFVSNPYIAAIGGVVATALTGSWTVIMAAVAYHLIVSEQPAAWVWP